MKDPHHTPWWQTLPAVLTGIAGVLGAVTALVTVLYQVGVFAPAPKPQNDPPPPAVTSPRYTEDAINIWIVGSPHTDNVPSSEVPPEIASNARDLRVRLDVKVFAAKGFAEAFFSAFESGNGPDVLVVDNYGHIDGITTPLGNFPGIASRAKVRDSLISVSESFSGFGDGWQFLFTNSRNHQNGKALAMAAPKCKPEFTESVSRLAPSEADEVRASAISAGYAYLTCNKESMASMSDKSRLGSGCIDQRNPYFTKNVNACGIFGNERISFIALVGSFSNDQGVGQKSLLAVLRKPLEKWQLLSITGDLASIDLLGGPVQRLAKSLVAGGPGQQAPDAADLVTPDWTFPSPSPDAIFGDFLWKPSASADVVGEVIEFEYGDATRMLISFDVSQSPSPKKISTGKLFQADGVWHWRIWSVARSGSMALSENRSFKNSDR
jgi:hypothetical protein